MLTLLQWTVMKDVLAPLSAKLAYYNGWIVQDLYILSAINCRILGLASWPLGKDALNLENRFFFMKLR